MNIININNSLYDFILNVKNYLNNSITFNILQAKFNVFLLCDIVNYNYYKQSSFLFLKICYDLIIQISFQEKNKLKNLDKKYLKTKFIEEYTLSWQAENRELKQGILKNCQKECADLMTSLKEPLSNRIQYFEKLKNQSCEVKAKFKKMDKEINKSSSMLAKKVQDLDKLIKKWKNDVERY